MFNQSLDSILSSLSGTVAKLEKFIENKQGELGMHQDVISRHTQQIQTKQYEVNRADRIRTKLNDLLK